MINTIEEYIEFFSGLFNKDFIPSADQTFFLLLA